MQLSRSIVPGCLGEGNRSAMAANFASYLANLSHLSVTDAKFCKKRITASEIQEAIKQLHKLQITWLGSSVLARILRFHVRFVWQPLGRCQQLVAAERENPLCC